jgi:hypothetical protein
LKKESTRLTRNRKKPPPEIILGILSKKELTAEMELREYFKDEKKPAKNITVQGDIYSSGKN